jgi:hypothetical protein
VPTPEQYRRAMVVVTARAVADASKALSPNPDEMLRVVPEVVAYYSDGTAALAADQYDELREAANPRRPWTAEPVVNLRDEKLRVGTLWAITPLQGDDPNEVLARERLAEVIQFEVPRPFRDTITTNARRDPAAGRWQRVPNPGACKFCSFLAGRGAVYRADTARFAAHPSCGCSAVPVFEGQQVGEPATTLQYVASSRHRSPAQRQRLREALAAMPD